MEFSAPVLFEKVVNNMETEIANLKAIILIYHRRGTFTAQQGQTVIDISREDKGEDKHDRGKDN